MKPITYWLQNDETNQLVEKYGAQLSKLRPESRRELIAFLANAENYWSSEESDADDAYRIVQRLTRWEKDLLIEAIAATLTHQGNPFDKPALNLFQQAQKSAPAERSAL